MSQEYKGQKFSKKTTTIWDKEQKFSRPGSVIQVFDRKTNEPKYFMFVNNPAEIQNDAPIGKTKPLASGHYARTKFVVPVKPLNNSTTEFIELDDEKAQQQVVRIFDSRKCFHGEKRESVLRQQRASSQFFSEIYDTPVLHAEIVNSKGAKKSYTILPYLGMRLSTLIKKGHQKIDGRPTSYITDLLDIKQALQLGLAISQTLDNFHHKKGYNHKDGHSGNWLVQIQQNPTSNNPFIANLIDFDRVIPSEFDGQLHDLNNLAAILQSLYQTLWNKGCVMAQGTLSILGGIKVPLIGVSLPQLIQSQSDVLAYIETFLLKDQPIHETQGLLYSSINTPPAPQKSSLENLIDSVPFSNLSRDKVSQLLSKFLEDHPNDPHLLSEKFLAFAYRYNPPLLTLEELKKIYPSSSPYWLATKAITLNLPNLLSILPLQEISGFKDDLFARAIDSGHTEIANLLMTDPRITLRVDIHTQCYLMRGEHHFSQTPLHWAAKRNNIALVQCLLDAGANINLLNSEKHTPLHLAKDIALIKLLLERGANPNFALGKQDNKKEAKLSEDTVAKDNKATPLFEQTPYDPKNHLMLTYQMHPPLCDAVAKRDHKRIIQLLGNGTNPASFSNDPKHHHKTPLMIAASAGDAETLAILLKDKGIQSTINTSNKKTALQFAIEGNHHEAMRLLLESGADPCTDTVLIAAADHGNQKTIALLMDDKRIKDNLSAQNFLMGKEYKVQKFRRDKTRDETQTSSHPSSVIQIFDPEAKRLRHFQFVNNPDEKQNDKDVKNGKTKVSSEQRQAARMKFAVPVEPYLGQFVQLPDDKKATYIVRIFPDRLGEQQRVSNYLFKQLYNTQVLHGELTTPAGKRKSYTVFPYMGMSLKNILEKQLENVKQKKPDIEKTRSSYTADLLNIKQALQLGLTICQTLVNLHEKGYCHNNAHRGNLLVQIKDGQFIVNIIDFDGVSPSKNGVQKDFDSIRQELQILYVVILQDTAYTMNQENLSILGKINILLSKDSSFPDLIKSQSAALTEIETLLQGKSVDETQGKLYYCINSSPASQVTLPKSDWENFANAPRDEAKQALLTLLEKSVAHLDQLLSENFLEFVYRYNPPLLTPEEFQKFFVGLSEEQLHWMLTKAVKLNLPSLLSTLILKINPSYKNELLGQAVKLNQTEIARLLIENGADIHKEYSLHADYRDFHQTLLHWAIHKNSAALVELLLDAGAHINLQNGSFKAPLHYAIIQHRNIPLIKFLLERGADPNQKDTDTHSKKLRSMVELIESVSWKTLEQREEAKRLISTYQMHPPLCDAVAKDDSKKADRLLKNGANPTLFVNDAKDANHQKNPLMIAASMGHIETLKFLLECKQVQGTINDSNEVKKTALHYAIEENQHEAIYTLLQHGAEPNSNSILMAAATHGNLKTIQLLLEDKKLKENYRGQSSLLIKAMELDHFELVISFIKSINSPSLEHLLHATIQKGNSPGSISLITLLLDAGVNINSADSAGNTPLNLAILTKNLALLKLLLEIGAEPNIKLLTQLKWTDPEAERLISTYQMRPPLCDATAKDESNSVTQLLKNGANPTLFNKDPEDAKNYQKNPIMIAASMGHIEILKVLLECKQVRATINDSNGFKKTALHYAIRGNQHEAIRILLQHGADPCVDSALIAILDCENSRTIELLMDDKRIKENSSVHNFLMNKGQKFSRKKTIIWDKEQKISHPGSVIKVFDPEAKESKYFKFVNNPDEINENDILLGKTTSLGPSVYSRTKFVVPVKPLNDKEGEFIDLHNDEKPSHIVRIFNSLNTQNYSREEQTKHKNGNQIFSQIYNTQTLYGELRNSKGKRKSYTILPYMGMSLQNLFEKCAEKIDQKQDIKSSRSSYATDLLDIKQALQLGLTICQTLVKLHEKGYCHNNVHQDNLLVQIKDGQFIINLTDFDMASSNPEDAQKDFDNARKELQYLYHNILHGKACTMHQENLSILGKINILLSKDSSFPDLIKSQSAALAEIETLLQGKSVDETQGRLYSCMNSSPVSQVALPKSDWENFANAPREEAKQALLTLLEKSVPHLDQFLSENFLEFVYRYNPPLLTPEEFQKFFVGLSEEQFHWILTKAVKLNLPSLLLTLIPKLNPNHKNELLGQAVILGHTEIVRLLIDNGADIHKEYSLDKNYSHSHQALLNWVTRQQNIALVELLLDAGAHINLQNSNSKAPLHFAIFNKNIPLIKLLLERGADPHLKGTYLSKKLLSVSEFIESITWKDPEQLEEVRHLISTYQMHPPLCNAVAKDDSKKVGQLLKNGANPTLFVNDAKHANHQKNPLMIAASMGHIETLKFLLEFKQVQSTINDSNEAKKTALHYAVEGNQHEAIRILLQHGADPSNTILMAAVTHGNLKTIQLLLEGKSTIEQPSAVFTLSWRTINSDRPDGAEILTFLLGKPFGISTESLNALLHLAVQKQNISFVTLLLHAGANVNSKNQGNTPLDLAMTTKNPDLIKLLLESGADPSFLYSSHSLVSTYQTHPPLCDAAEQGDHGRVTQLLKNGANPALINSDDAKRAHYQKNPLMIAASTGNINVMKALLDSKEVRHSIHQQHYSGDTALHYAARHGHAEAVDLLLSNGANPNSANALNRTPLAEAVLFGEQDKPEIVESLLREGKYSSDLKNEMLRAAAKRSYYGTAASLVIYGADPNLGYINNTNDSLLTAAVGKNKEESLPFITALLKNKNTKVNHRNNHGDTALSLAVWNDNSTIAKQLLEAGANPFSIAPDDKMPFIASSQTAYLKNPPILEAVKRNDIDLVAKLLQDKASLTQKNQLGQTALDIAREKNHVDIVKYIFLAAAEHRQYDMMFQAYDALPENKKSKWQAHNFYSAPERLAEHLCDELPKIIKANEDYLRSSFTRISSFFSKIPVLSSDQLGKCRNALKTVLELRHHHGAFIIRGLDFAKLKDGQHPFIAKKISMLQRCCEYTKLSHAVAEVPEEDSVPETKESKSATFSASSSSTCSSSFLPGPRSGKLVEFDPVEPEKPFPEYYPEILGPFLAGELPTFLG